MSSLYDVLFDDIPLFVVPETEDSEVIEYETAMQRNVRFCNEAKAKQQMEEIARLEAFVERFRYKATKARQAQDREKKLNRMRETYGDDVTR